MKTLQRLSRNSDLETFHLALFYDGSKKETWKADMDGELDIDNKDIKGSIDDVLAEDVF